MHPVSSAGAIGAMQVLPATGRWMSGVVGRPLNLRDVHDNATAGVVLLDLLLERARPRVAVAGYYQGLAGVRRHGMYRDTERYVANVLALQRQFERGDHPA
jgi:soluble lytic murein transglycosylase-like protein